MSMDAAVQLALMAKAKKVFGTEGAFLSFPVAPLPYTRPQLEFFDDKDADAARASDQNLAQFSALVNLIPLDEAWLPTETLFLWQVYEEVLKGNYAISSRTDEEEAAYQAAGAFLGSIPAGGGWQDSPAVSAYKTCEDAVRIAQEQYLAVKSTAESSSDPEQQKRWREVDEPAARAGLDALNARWLAEGQKNEVEQARARRANLGARSPLQTWQQWRSRFNPDIDTVTDTSNFTVFPSPFAPRNALDEGAWKTFQLTKDELPALLEEIPAPLKERFGVAAPPASVLSIDFEFSSALIQREWFASDALKARFWRFADGTAHLSDGAAPPSGRCPAYVTAVVFGRRVKMETIGAAAPQQAFEAIRFPAAAAGQVRLAQIPAERLAAPAAVSDRLARLIKETPPRLLATRPVLNIQERATVPPVAGVQAMGATAGTPMVRAAHLESIAAVRPILRPPAKNGPAIEARINPRHELARNLPTRPGTPNIPIVRPRRQVTQVTPDDQIFILAFVCKEVPKCPDPDPALQW